MTRLSGILGRLRSAKKSVIYNLGLENSLYSFVEQRPFILLFHNILRNKRVDINVRNFGVVEFEKILRYLKSHYRIVPLEELVAQPQVPNTIAITFDDGLINNLRYALPVLERLEVPATIFITTRWLHGSPILWPDRWSLLSKKLDRQIDFEGIRYEKNTSNTYRNAVTGEKLTDVFLRTNPADRDRFMDEIAKKLNYYPEQDTENEDLWRLMNGAEIKILAQSPWIEIGSHCVNHENLLFLTREQQMEELTESKRYLEQIIGKEVKSIAYPFGIYDDPIIKLSLDSGYSKLLVVNKLFTKNSNIVFDRFGLYNHQSLSDILHSIRTHQTASDRL